MNMNMDFSTTEQAEGDSSTFEEWQWPRLPVGSTYIPIRPTPPRSKTRNAPAPCPPLLLLDNADTLVFIDSPPRPSTSSVLPASRGYIPHRVHSRKLLETDSSFFKKLFNPRTQARIVKRRELTGGLTNGLKYVIDLTPPTEGEEAVITITELSCPLGIRSWTRCQNRWYLPASCVGGQDQVEALDTNTRKGFGGPPSHESNNSVAQNPETDERAGNHQEGEVGKKAVTSPEASDSKVERQNLELPLDYSASRHHAGIEQILQALEDFPPQLDTPCKLWTFFALAKLYDIATTPKICDLILSWFYESTNVRFIEIHPEISYRIACGIQCASLCRDTFSILVGEEALLLLANGDGPARLGRPQVTWHGRLRESLDDTELQRIDMAWLHGLSEFQKVYHFQPRSSQEEEAKSWLLTALKDFVRCTLLSPLRGGVPERGCREVSLSSQDHEGYPPPDFANAYREMSPAERIISRTFWHSLSIESFSGQCPILPAKQPSIIASLAKSIPQFREQEDWHTSGILRKGLIGRVVDFNTFYRRLGRRVFDLDTRRPQMTANTPTSGFSIYSAPQLQNLPGIDLVLPREMIEFDLDIFFAQVRAYVNDYAKQMITPRSSTMFYELTDALTCLTENEFKYLPLWADRGFSTPGPAIHTGSTASSVMSHSTIAASEIDTTVQGASNRATESHQSDLMSIDTDIEQDSGRNSDHVSFSWQSADDDTSIDLSSADDEEFEFGSASDSTDTVVMGSPSHSDLLSDFEEVHMDDNDSASRH
ncbi:uncharacterized protein P174DRAFT_511016 [Aspergillus novofumigatus IBT 16806]|uniref:BTB domain-containing protein n=1 Tax=Aspergillus novofumigatus (strain IBT 16806) TaxID=1392255 RepID=A0A2I1CC62_ASPN1|nr:uncharacterized protein P174DRAFT_511016 [Aspergillus novofumigatus IBT 16806]PKX95218.1 hypothetical protein P174DRAFT_511016 [Aspergillus novofumigatus IBT 16806]